MQTLQDLAPGAMNMTDAHSPLPSACIFPITSSTEPTSIWHQAAEAKPQPHCCLTLGVLERMCLDFKQGAFGASFDTDSTGMQQKLWL